MPLHDWTRVSPNDFHDMHTSWIAAIRTRLNTGLLPEGYYALAEHEAPPYVPDVLTLGGEGADGSPTGWLPGADAGGGGGVAAAIQAEVTLSGSGQRRAKPPARWVAVRHAQGRRLVAVIEIVSPGNKAKAKAIRKLVQKSAALLENGIHLVIVDVFPNPARLPRGFGGAVWRSLLQREAEYSPQFSRTHSAFAAQADRRFVAHFQSSEVGSALPVLPLYLSPVGRIDLPLEETYQTAWAGYPKPLRGPLELPAPTA